MTSADELQAMLDAATPGPWSAARNSAYWEVAPKRKPLDYTIPLAFADVCASDPDNPDGGLQEANARLIALAPDLARKVIAAENLDDALKVMVQEAVELAESGDAGFWDPEVVESVIASRAALAAWEAAQ